jgi:hypothetical protein
MIALPFRRGRGLRTGPLLACVLLLLIAAGILAGHDGAAASPAPAAAPANMAMIQDTQPTKACPPVLPSKPKPYPGLGNPDAGAPVGDYGDAPDGLFPYPTNTAPWHFPTLWHHGGAFTRNVTQEWLGPRVSVERGASDLLDPDGRPNLLYLGTLPLIAGLDCYNDGQPSIDLVHKTFQVNVSVAATAPKVRRVLNVVADRNLNGGWDAPKEWVVRNCTFLVPSPSSTRIQCPLVSSASPLPAFTVGTIVKPGARLCPPNVWYRILLTRGPITAGTIPGPWKGWDGRGPKKGFPYGEVEDYLCPCASGSDVTPTRTPTPRPTKRPSGTPTKVPTMTPKPSATPTQTRVLDLTATPTVTATPTCVPVQGTTLCSGTATTTTTPAATPTCIPNAAGTPCTPPSATPTCVPNSNGTPCTTPPHFDITVKHDYAPQSGAVVFCLSINPSYAPTNQIYDLEWLGTPWTGASTGTLPPGWLWDTGFVGGKRAYTTATPPWSTGGSNCFGLQVPPTITLSSPITIDASNQLGQIIGYLLS